MSIAIIACPVLAKEIKAIVREVPEAPTGSVIIKNDLSDDVFLRCCQVAKAKALISLDRQLLKLQQH